MLARHMAAMEQHALTIMTASSITSSMAHGFMYAFVTYLSCSSYQNDSTRMKIFVSLVMNMSNIIMYCPSQVAAIW